MNNNLEPNPIPEHQNQVHQHEIHPQRQPIDHLNQHQLAMFYRNQPRPNKCDCHVRELLNFAIILIGISNYTKYNQAQVPFGTWYLIFTFLLCGITVLASNHENRKLEIMLAFIILFFHSVIGLHFWIIILFTSTEAFSVDDYFFFSVFFALVSCFILCVVGSVISFFISRYRQVQRQNKAKEDYVLVVREIAKSRNFDLESFWRMNPTMFSSLELQPIDYEFIKKNCISQIHYTNRRGQEQGQKECVICISGLREGEEDILYHPGCSHTFHWNCIQEWFKNGKKICPMCRLETRKSLLLSIRGTQEE